MDRRGHANEQIQVGRVEAHGQGLVGGALADHPCVTTMVAPARAAICRIWGSLFDNARLINGSPFVPGWLTRRTGCVGALPEQRLLCGSGRSSSVACPHAPPRHTGTFGLNDVAQLPAGLIRNRTAVVAPFLPGFHVWPPRSGRWPLRGWPAPAPG